MIKSFNPSIYLFRFILPLISFTGIISYSAQAQNMIGNQEDLKVIANNAELFSEYLVSADYEKLVQSYTKDAKIFPNGTKILVGFEEIEAYWRLPEGTQIKYHKIIPEEIVISGLSAYDYGYYEGITLKKDGSENSWKGKYVIVWKKEGDSWKIYLDIWNSVKK